MALRSVQVGRRYPKAERQYPKATRAGRSRAPQAPPRPARDVYGFLQPFPTLCNTRGGVRGRNGRNPRFRQL